MVKGHMAAVAAPLAFCFRSVRRRRREDPEDASAGGDLPQGSEPVELDPAKFTVEIDNRYWPMEPVDGASACSPHERQARRRSVRGIPRNPRRVQLRNAARRSLSSASSRCTPRGSRSNGSTCTRPRSCFHVPATRPSTRKVEMDCGVFVLNTRGR
jgi:hypothetical protein